MGWEAAACSEWRGRIGGGWWRWGKRSGGPRERGAAGGRRLERRQGAGLELLLAVRARWRSTATTT